MTGATLPYPLSLQVEHLRGALGRWREGAVEPRIDYDLSVAASVLLRLIAAISVKSFVAGPDVRRGGSRFVAGVFRRFSQWLIRYRC